MKHFSIKWIGSKRPNKQRKYIANAPLHRKRKLLSVNLAKDLREKYQTRNIEIRKGDKVKIMRGKFKGKEGKIIEVKTKLQKIYIEGIQTKKQDGSKVNVPLRSSNLQILELVLDDKKRMPKKIAIGNAPSDEKKQKTETKTQTPKKENKPVIKEKKEQ